MSSRTWLKIRLGLITFGFAGALLESQDASKQLADMLTDWLFAAFVVLSLAAIPLIILALVGICASASKADTKWVPPTHCSRPFSLENPLLFLHFAAHFIGASGLGLLVSSLWNGLWTAVHGVSVVFGALMVLVGIRLCMRLFKHKMATQPSPRQGEATDHC